MRCKKLLATSDRPPVNLDLCRTLEGMQTIDIDCQEHRGHMVKWYDQGRGSFLCEKCQREDEVVEISRTQTNACSRSLVKYMSSRVQEFQKLILYFTNYATKGEWESQFSSDKWLKKARW